MAVTAFCTMVSVEKHAPKNNRVRYPVEYWTYSIEYYPMKHFCPNLTFIPDKTFCLLHNTIPDQVWVPNWEVSNSFIWVFLIILASSDGHGPSWVEFDSDSAKLEPNFDRWGTILVPSSLARRLDHRLNFFFFCF